MQYILKINVVLCALLMSNTVFAENISGPRIGGTFLSNKTIQDAKEKGINVTNVISQFGWQFESAFFTTQNGPQGVTALIPMLGGADQGVLIPSISWVTGLRSQSGFEFAVGPNVSLSGVGMAFSVGKTNKVGEVNFPINVSVVSSNSGMRVSLLFGFNSIDGH